MPHLRHRHIEKTLLKRLKIAPVVTIQGVRQCGKSYLMRDILAHELNQMKYVTFDEKSLKEFALNHPSTFLDQHYDFYPLVIDEAQKVPDIFDAVKFRVDKKRIPGSFILLGSTEFSKMLLIRESLTGRMSQVRLYPLNLAESLKLSMKNITPTLISEKPRIDRAALMRYLYRGGLPGIFSIREDEHRNILFRDWILLTCNRDIHQFPKIKLDSDLTYNILEKIVLLEEPNITNLSKALHKDPRIIKKHIEALKTLFVIHELKPHDLGIGKPLYFMCDLGIAASLGADFNKLLWTWVLLENLSQRSYQTDLEHKIFYYRSPKGSIIHLIIESLKEIYAVKIFSKEKTDKRELENLKGFHNKAKYQTKKTVQLRGLGSTQMVFKQENIYINPWESLG